MRLTFFQGSRPETSSFSPKHQHRRSPEIQVGIELTSVRINGDGVDCTILQSFEYPAKIDTPRHTHILNGSGRRSGHTRRQTHGATIGNENPVNSGQISRSEDRPKILRILHTVQRKQKRRFRLLRRMRKDRIL